MKRKCKKILQETRINPIVQLWKHYYWMSKHEAGQSMSAAMSVTFHVDELYHELKWNIYAFKASVSRFWLAEILMHKPCWCLDC